jgi:hypothetical protein
LIPATLRISAHENTPVNQRWAKYKAKKGSAKTRSRKIHPQKKTCCGKKAGTAGSLSDSRSCPSRFRIRLSAFFSI